MCRRDQSSGWWLVALCLLVLFFSARTVWGDETLPLSAPSTLAPSPLTISGWQSFDEAWASLKAELTASDEDWARLLTLLQGLQTEVDELQSSLEESTRLLLLSDQGLATERQRAYDAIEALEAAQVSRNRWRALAGLSGAIAAGFILISIF